MQYLKFLEMQYLKVLEKYLKVLEMQSQKQQNDLYSLPRQTTQYHSNPMPQPVMLKKLKLNGSLKTYKTF